MRFSLKFKTFIVASVLFFQQSLVWAQKPIATFSHNDYVNTVAFSPDGNYILTGSDGRTAVLWDRDGKVLQTFSHNDKVNTVGFSPNGNYILTGSWDETAVLWNKEGEELQTFSCDGFSIIDSVAFSPDGNFILIGSTNKNAELFSLKTN